MNEYKPDEYEETNGTNVDSLVSSMLYGKYQHTGNDEVEYISAFEFDSVHTFFETAALASDNITDVSNSYINIKECIKFYCQYYRNPEKYICETSITEFVDFFASHDFIGFLVKGIFTNFQLDIVESSLFMLWNYFSIARDHQVCDSEEITEVLVTRLFNIVKNPNIILAGEKDGVPNATISSLFKSSVGKMSSFQFNSIRTNGLECISQLIQRRQDVIEIIHSLNLIDTLIETSIDDIFSDETLSRTQLILCQLLRAAPEPFDIDIIVQFAARYIDINFKPFAPALYLIYYVIKYAPMKESVQIAMELSSNSVGQRIAAQICDRRIRTFEPLNRIIRQIVKKAPDAARYYILSIIWPSTLDDKGCLIMLRTFCIISQKIEGSAEFLISNGFLDPIFNLFDQGAFGSRRKAAILFSEMFTLIHNFNECIKRGLWESFVGLVDPEDVAILGAVLSMASHALRNTAEGTPEGDEARSVFVSDYFVPAAIDAVDCDNPSLAEAAMDFLDAADIDY